MIAAIGAVVACSGDATKPVAEADEEKKDEERGEKLVSVADFRADLALLMATLEEVHPDLYHHVRREEIRVLTEETAAAVTRPASVRELYLPIARLVARFEEGHTFVSFPSDALKARAEREPLLFPLEVRVLEDGGLEIATDYGPGSLRRGDRIRRIDARAARELVERFRAHTSGETRAYRDAIIARSFAATLWMHGIDAPFELEVASRSGSSQEIRLAGVSFGALHRLRLAGTGADGPPHRFEVLAGGVGYLELRAMDDLAAFEKLLERSFATLREAAAPSLIVDVRHNSGGNSRLGDALLRYVTDRPYRNAARKEWKASRPYLEFLEGKPFGKVLLGRAPGEVVVVAIEPRVPEATRLRFTGPVCFLIGPATFSSGVKLVDAVATYDLATLIGRPTGGRPTGYGEVYTFTLPATGLEVGVPTALWVRANGDAADLGPVRPDIEVPADVTPEAALSSARRWVLDAAKGAAR